MEAAQRRRGRGRESDLRRRRAELLPRQSGAWAGAAPVEASPARRLQPGYVQHRPAERRRPFDLPARNRAPLPGDAAEPVGATGGQAGADRGRAVAGERQQCATQVVRCARHRGVAEHAVRGKARAPRNLCARVRGLSVRGPGAQHRVASAVPALSRLAGECLPRAEKPQRRTDASGARGDGSHAGQWRRDRDGRAGARHDAVV